MNIQKWQKAAYNLAKEKGWYDKENSPLEYHMLMVSEIAEAAEEVRKGTAPIYYRPGGKKPGGEAIELADAMIRILSYCEYRGWDIEEAMRIKHEYNKTRAYMHGGKKI